MGFVRNLVASFATVGLMVCVVSSQVSAQTADSTIPPQQSIKFLVNIPGAPAGVTGYQVDSICRNVPGAGNGNAVVTMTFPVAGGSSEARFPLGTTTNCSFRITVLGTGPRPLSLPNVTVGGEQRGWFYVATTDPQTSIETAPIAITGPTTVTFGTALVVVATTTSSTSTTSPTTTTAPATLPPTTTTPVTTSVTSPPVASATVAPSTAPPTSTTAASRAALALPVVKTPAKKMTTAKKKVTYRKVCAQFRSKKCVKYRYVPVK